MGRTGGTKRGAPTTSGVGASGRIVPPMRSKMSGRPTGAMKFESRDLSRPCARGQAVAVGLIAGCSLCHEIGSGALPGQVSGVNDYIHDSHALSSGGNRVRSCFPTLVNLTPGGRGFVSQIGTCLGGVDISISRLNGAFSVSFF